MTTRWTTEVPVAEAIFAPLKQEKSTMEEEQSELYRRGIAARRKVLGDEYVDSVTTDLTELDREWQRLVTEHAWGDIWGRESGMSLKQRSLNNLCILAALNRPHELEIHIMGAIRNGVTVEEIRETFLQVAVYAGMPAGLDAFKIAKRVLRDEGLLD
jgi:4-carboxymuconolactone decarboxylase